MLRVRLHTNEDGITQRATVSECSCGFEVTNVEAWEELRLVPPPAVDPAGSENEWRECPCGSIIAAEVVEVAFLPTSASYPT
jgi:hypothetical protein